MNCPKKVPAIVCVRERGRGSDPESCKESVDKPPFPDNRPSPMLLVFLWRGGADIVILPGMKMFGGGHWPTRDEIQGAAKFGCRAKSREHSVVVMYTMPSFLNNVRLRDWFQNLVSEWQFIKNRVTCATVRK